MMYQLLLPGMYFKKEISVQSLIQFLAVIVSFPLNFLLIKYIGILGASIGVMLGHLMLVILTLLWNHHRKSFYIKIEYEWRRIGAFSIIYVLMALFSLMNGIENIIANFILSFIGIIVTFLLIVQLMTTSELSRIPILAKMKLLKK